MLAFPRKCVGLRLATLASRTPYLGSSYFMSSLAEQFDKAKERLNALKEDPGNEAKLKIYGLFKQATEGAVQTSRPGITNFVARAKYDAWKALDSLSKEEAQKAYVDFINTLSKSEDDAEEAQKSSGQKFKNLLIEVDGGLRKITLNRPSRFNAITKEMYDEWREALEDAKNDPKTTVTAITGAGDYYCSGNDLSNFSGVPKGGEAQFSSEMAAFLHRFVKAHIDFPKPLAAVVNGPAFGISVTLLSLCDVVYASDRATFITPFSRLGQGPEGCSTFTYPRMMGLAKANELLLFDKKLNAQEAYDRNMVSEVFPHETFYDEVWAKLKKFSELPPLTLVFSKESVRSQLKEELYKANDIECRRLEERWISEECRDALISFMTRKKQ